MPEPHVDSEELGYLSASEMVPMLARGDLTSADVVARLSDRISAIDAPGSALEVRSILDVNTWAVTDAQRCDEERRARHGDALGPLHGVPVVVKDNVEVEGMRATAGSLALDAGPCPLDAPLVARLRNAGAIILATTNLSEWANIRSSRSTSGWSAVGGLVGNPWALDRSAGGSSSGSGAALAAGLAPLAVGTETDGSITCPAALNGVVGIKPTVGVVPTTGVVPISASQDSPGAMARSVDDAERLLSVLTADANLCDRSSRINLAEVRIGVARHWFTGHARVDSLVSGVVADIRSQFSAVHDDPVPAPDKAVGDDEYTVLMCELLDDLNAYLSTRQNSRVTSLAHVIEFNRAHSDEELAFFDQELFEESVTSGGRAGDKYHSARRRNLDWAHNECFTPAFQRSDILVAPAYMPAWKSDFAIGHPEAGGIVTSPAAIAGFPIVTIPCGLVNDLPVGMSFVGPANSEALLIAAARAVERVLGLSPTTGWKPQFSLPGRG